METAGEPSKGGRPPHEPTAETRERVEILLGGGMTQEQVAAAIGISAPTLREHYADEIANGRSRKRAEVIAAMFRAAVGGNVSAQKAYVAQPAELHDPAPAQAKPEPMGKKAAAQVAAAEAGKGGDWGSLLPH